MPVMHGTLKGVAILAVTWAVVLGTGYPLLASAWRDEAPASYRDYEETTGWPIPSYHVLLLVMLPTVFWVWATVAWIGMKFFRHG